MSFKEFHNSDNGNDYFFNMNLDDDIKILYDTFATTEQKETFSKKAYINEMARDNYKKYYEIDIVRLLNLPKELSDKTTVINELYNSIDINTLLSCNESIAIKNKNLLDIINKKIEDLNEYVDGLLKILYESNDKKQSQFNIQYFKNLNISEKLKDELLEKYNKLVLYSATIEQDKYYDLKRQITRKNYISELYKLLGMSEPKKINLTNEEKLEELNALIEEEIKKYNDKIVYLQEMMIKKSKYSLEFRQFKNNYNKLITYDNQSYESAKEKYNFLKNENKISISLKSFEKLFKEEIESINKQSKFVIDNNNINKVINTINYINNYYINNLDEESKQIISIILNNINNNNYNLEEINKVLNIIINDIWKNAITSIYSYNNKEDFYFICSNEQFIYPKHQAMLISKNQIEKLDDYGDFQIGFICGYNNNIIYITENEDIINTGNNNDFNLKTPKQVEDEFLSSKKFNKIVLDGYKTKIEAVYYIKDENKNVYFEALKLANENNLPLIEIKKPRNF